MLIGFQVLLVAVMLVEFTHQAMVVIICLVDLTYAVGLLYLCDITVNQFFLCCIFIFVSHNRLVAAPTHHYILIAVWVAAVTWGLVVPVHIIDVSLNL